MRVFANYHKFSTLNTEIQIADADKSGANKFKLFKNNNNKTIEI